MKDLEIKKDLKNNGYRRNEKKYVYPAIFTEDEKGMYSVDFIDLESCYTCGDDIEDAFLNAQDVLTMVLRRYFKSDMGIPKPSKIKEIEVDNKSFVSYVAVDMDEEVSCNKNS